jgi:hypothetical protein
MPKIVFRRKIYYSVFEMPPNIRRAYEKEQKKAGADSKKEKPESVTDPLPSAFGQGAGAGAHGLMWGILVALVISGIAYLLSRFLP